MPASRRPVRTIAAALAALLLAGCNTVVLSPPGEGMRGVLFYDAAGEPAFGIYLPGEGETPSAALVRQFEATAREIRALPALCTASAR